MFNPNDLSYFARAMAMRGGMPGYSGMMRGQGLLSGPFNGNLQGAPIPQMPPWFQRPGSIQPGVGPAPIPQSPMQQPMPQPPQSTMPQPQNAMGLNGSPYQGNYGGSFFG